MSDATVLNFGQINGTGARDALFLKVFGGEVLTAFHDANVMMPLHRVRTIAFGKSAQFPVLWKVTSAYHTVGTELLGQAVNHNERVITIQDMLIADVFVAEYEELQSHYDVRAPYSREIGESLAETLDKHILQVGVLAARASATVTGGNGGSVLTNSAFSTTGSVIAAGIFDAAEDLDERDVPDNSRYAAFRPAEYYLLAQTTNVINRDWGGSGAYAEGSVLKVAGVSIIKTNNVPSTNITTGPSEYQGNFSTTTGLVWHETAMGTVKLRDIALVVAPDPRRVGTLIYGKVAVGSDYLRPESAVEFKTS